MRVLLVSCYELGHQPLGLASAAAHLAAEGFAVECLDLAVEPFDESRVKAAGFVGISVPMHTAIRLGVQAARRVREMNPGAHICFYGLYASLNADYLLRTGGDSVVGGEFESPLTELVRSLSGGGTNGHAGVSTRDKRSKPFLGRQRFCVPARGQLPPLERYARVDTGKDLTLVGYVEASRGCAHRCLHCPITPVYGGRLRIVQEDVVRADVSRLVGIGAGHITFGDPDFLNGVKHALRIARNLHADFPHLTFDFTSKVEHVLEHRGLFEELKALGCLFVVSAVESVNDTVLAHLEKGHRRADVVEALGIMRAAGIAVRVSLLPFTPWTSLEDYLDMLEFVEEHDLIYNVDPVHYSLRLLVPPGSSLLGTPQMTPYLDGLDEENFSYRWSHPEPRVDTLHLEVCRTVESAARVSEDPLITFYKVKQLGLAALAGRPLSSARLTRSPSAVRPPRLTESWFC